MSQKAFYITTTLPYVNSDPHVGFAMEMVRADIIARWKIQEGYNVFFNTGTDEHGQKLYDAAKKAGKEVQTYVDEYAKKFQELVPLLGISPDIHFIRTTDAKHEAAAQEFWNRVNNNGYIYKKNYSAKYCVGCEENKTDSDLVDGHCSIHPHLDIQIIEEENYFFKFSEFGDRLLAMYDVIENEGRSFVIPQFRLNEMREFVKRGLEDFSISRLRSKMSWGVAVPNDPDHVMYVWFDALTSYISTLDWPNNSEQFDAYWKNGTPVQYCGKDNTRFQSVMWQSMLMAADLPPSHTIVVNGFLTSGGQKMSKSLGNVINPVDVVNEFGVEAFRYFVARELQPFEDSDFTIEKFKESYNANLANGIGNLVSRIMKMSVQYEVDILNREAVPIPQVGSWIEVFDLSRAMDEIWFHISEIDKTIADEKPFSVYKENPEKAKELVKLLLFRLQDVAISLNPLMPETSKEILRLIKENKSPDKPLFARKD